MSGIAMQSQLAIFHGTSLFLFIFCLQVMIWKPFRIRKQMLSLAILYFIFPLFIFSALLMLEVPFESVASKGIVYFSLACAYVISFPAVQAQSPSLQILIEVARSQKTNALDRTKLHERLHAESLLNDRMKDLSQDQLMVGTKLSWGGKALAHIFSKYRKCIGLKENTG